jgi:hypothetical protein
MAVQNKLVDLNNHLFAQLERLDDETLDDEQIKREIERGKAITSVANAIISNATLALKVEEFKEEYGTRREPAQLPNFLESGTNEQSN